MSTRTIPATRWVSGPTLTPCPICDELAPVQFRRHPDGMDMRCSSCGHNYPEATS